MIYLYHPDTQETRTCETEELARRAEAQGFIRISHEAWSAVNRTHGPARQAEVKAEDEEERKRAERRRWKETR